MKRVAIGTFGAELKALREAAGFTQEELATIAGLSVHAVSALERGERRRPHLETVRALSGALDLNGERRDALFASARGPAHDAAVDELSGAQLPVALTPLLGRDADVRVLRHWLADPAPRLITLVGPGGVGKTRLALEVAGAIQADGKADVRFVELASIRDAAFVAPAIAEALGMSDATAAGSLRRDRAVRDKDTPTLLVLDNCEQVLAAAPLVADFLAAIPSIRVLTTSRAPLRVRGERQYPVGPLALPAGSDMTSPANLARVPAVRLFIDRVRDVQREFRLTPANGPVVTAICRRLDALPLALELAATRMKVLTAAELLLGLERDLLFSTLGARDLPERQRTMSTTVAWSYQLLGSREQQAFRRFGALPGRFPIEAAAAVVTGGASSQASTDMALSAVADLIDKSLLQRIEAPVARRPLYRMLETVRAYAALELAESGERDDALEGLAAYCTTEASRAADGLVGPAQIEWLNRVRADLDNYRGALTWLIERGRAVEASGIAWGLMFFWLIRGRAAEGLQWYERILNLPGLPPAAESRVLVAAAVMSYTVGDRERARTRIARALILARGADDMAVVAHAENLLGHIEHTTGNIDAAADLFRCSVERFRMLELPWGAGNALIGMAGVALAGGDVHRAERLLDEATSVLRQAGPWFLNLPLYIRAILAVRREDPDAAIACVRESLVCSRRLQDKFAFVYALVPLAAAAAQIGDYAWTGRILGARDAVTERTGTTVSDGSVRDLREQAERSSRARLGAGRWARAYAVGRGASIDSLLKDIDSFRTRHASLAHDEAEIASRGGVAGHLCAT